LVIGQVRRESEDRIPDYEDSRYTTRKCELDLRRLVDVTSNGDLVTAGVPNGKCSEGISGSWKTLNDELSRLRDLPANPQRGETKQDWQESWFMPKSIFGPPEESAPRVLRLE